MQDDVGIEVLDITWQMFSVPQVNDSISILHKLPAIDVNIICNVNIIMDIMSIANAVNLSHGMRRRALALWKKFSKDR